VSDARRLPYQFWCGRQLESDYLATLESRSPSGRSEIHSSPAVFGPLLDSKAQSSAQEETKKRSLGKKQKRQYQRQLSWLTEAGGRNLQLFRLDLTGSDVSDASLLRRHWQELRRRIKRRYGLYLDCFVVETSEGNGVLHLVVGVAQGRAAWIDQKFLSAEWEKIHGAFIVSIKRMGGKKKDRRCVSFYMVTQYMKNQGEGGSALVRYSWSWWHARIKIGRGWTDFKRIVRFIRYRVGRDLRKAGRESMGFYKNVPFPEVIAAWESLLTSGVAKLRDRLLVVDRGTVVEWGYIEQGSF